MIRDWPKRIFIAINFPENIKSRLAVHQKGWPKLPCNWIPPENLHITLAFLGNTGEKELKRIKGAVKEITQRNQPIAISLRKICYGPPKIKSPSLVWAEGEKNRALTNLKTDLDKALFEITDYSAPKRDYIPHITLGRIKKFKWRRFSSGSRPVVNKDIDMDFRVSSIEIMESELKRTGAKYYILKSFKLGKDV